MIESSKKTITIGIYAHNTASDILYLLRSILKQKGLLFSIDEIIVISDGSQDSTALKVAKYSEKYPMIKLMKYDSYQGKIVRLHQIFEIAKSDYVVVFDGNIILTKNDTIENMIKALNEEGTALASVNTKSMIVKGIKANIIKMWQNVQYNAQKIAKNGNNIYNFNGSAFAINSKFAKRIIFPNILKNDIAFLYLLAKVQNLKFTYVSDSVVLIHTPATFQEYFDKKHIIKEERKSLLPIFGKEVRNEFKLPFSNILPSYIFSAVKNPLIIPVMILFFFANFLPYHSRKTSIQNSVGLNSAKRKIHSY